MAISLRRRNVYPSLELHKDCTRLKWIECWETRGYENEDSFFSNERDLKLFIPQTSGFVWIVFRLKQSNWLVAPHSWYSFAVFAAFKLFLKKYNYKHLEYYKVNPPRRLIDLQGWYTNNELQWEWKWNNFFQFPGSSERFSFFSA